MIKYYFVGEVHGTNECPHVCLDIAHRYSVRNIAFEMTAENIASIESNAHSIDGRISPAVKGVVNEAKRRGLSVFGVDGEASTADERDAIMAKNLSKINGPVVFLCGNRHASKEKYWGSGGNELVNPCASLLPKNEVVSFRIIPLNGGSFYNMGQVRIWPVEEELKSKCITPPCIVKSDESRYDYYYLLDRFTAVR